MSKDDGEESIYKLIPKEKVESPKAPMFRSRFHDPPPAKRAGATFGPPGGTKKPDPQAFTTKGSGETKREEVRKEKAGKVEKAKREKIKPAVSARRWLQWLWKEHVLRHLSNHIQLTSTLSNLCFLQVLLQVLACTSVPSACTQKGLQQTQSGLHHLHEFVQ